MLLMYVCELLSLSGIELWPSVHFTDELIPAGDCDICF
jgi:hypothetical protein